MNGKHRLQSFLATLCVMSICAAASAQAPVRGRATPLSNLGGHTGQDMAEIYNQAIGSGYSVQSLNSIALSNAYARSGYAGKPSGTPASQRPISYFQPSGGGVDKPFSGFSPSPTTSPYLNLFREDFAGNSDLNYNTLVRPQLQQQAFNQQVQRQVQGQGQEMARRMRSMAAQSDFNPQGDKNQFPTGHQTVMKYYGHFYPDAPYRPGKRF